MRRQSRLDYSRWKLIDAKQNTADVMKKHA